MATSDGSTENPENSVFLLRWPCEHDDASYTSPITKPPEGLGVRLVSAGPLFFFRCLAVGLLCLSACAPWPAAPSDGALQLHPGVRVDRAGGQVLVQATVACRRGFLEQVACRRGSREHESLLVIDAPASAVHAALLAVGLQPGAPGAWRSGADGAIKLTPPTGPEVRVLVRTADAGEPVPIEAWLRDLRGPGASPPRFVFAGSRFVAGPGGERYLADESGSIIGLVTFGDETLALHEVLPDRVGVEPAHFQARTEAMPEQGQAVTLVLRAVP